MDIVPGNIYAYSFQLQVQFSEESTRSKPQSLPKNWILWNNKIEDVRMHIRCSRLVIGEQARLDDGAGREGSRMTGVA